MGNGIFMQVVMVGWQWEVDAVAPEDAWGDFIDHYTLGPTLCLIMKAVPVVKHA